MDDGVRTAGADDLDGVVAVLTDAFHDDPLMSWAFPDEDARAARLRGLWTFMAGTAYLPLGASTVVPAGPPAGASGADAAALWLAPDQRLGDDFWQARGGQLVAALDGDVGRLSALSEVMAAHHPGEPHWYLLAIGVAPARQGGRLGSALLAHTLALADRTAAPAYLEATSPRSRALYERVGFRVTGELPTPDGPPLWAMWREPARS